MSFYTSLSGLKGAQADLSVISNNVANVGTIGFKKSRTEFGDIISASPLQSGSVAGQGARLKGIVQQFGQGGFQASERALDLAISGQGFFVTRNDLTGGAVSFTRAGSFGVDQNRYVTDGRGAYLQVLPVDSQGIVTATGLAATRNLQVPLTSGTAKATGNVSLATTLPTSADLPAARAVYQNGTPYAFDRLDPNSYNYSTATSVFDVSGNEIPATVYYTRTKLPDAADPTTTWEARLFVGGQEVSSNPAQAAPAAPLTLTFDATGAMTSPVGGVQYATSQASSGAAPLALTIDYSGTAQAAAPFTLKAFEQDGYAAGQLDNVSVSNDGIVSATFSNGDTIPLGKLALANFANPGGLRQLGDAAWSLTGRSGEAIVGEAAKGGFGVIQSGALEQANVDITEELVALISAQRNFQANAKAIETANALTQTIVNLG
ncbi:flagellar hook protein FlgE [Sphingomonas gilva]|uniref:Flagellar hook protein FlgE n=1 Tax=Sphingomonas gilva TaxID=2305907 RepID=A0A396RPV1_9SPHN|nr:flagellar hook protein FlgE [Sphingomonas gilva]RHW18478.1 flagellar hook protein FlgE [Sphingomonas gilva]